MRDFNTLDLTCVPAPPTRLVLSGPQCPTTDLCSPLPGRILDIMPVFVINLTHPLSLSKSIDAVRIALAISPKNDNFKTLCVLKYYSKFKMLDGVIFL